MMYISQLLETSRLIPLLREYDLGLEVISFSIGEILDDMEPAVRQYKEEFSSLITEKVPLTFHGPFLDLLPGSCDKRVRELAMQRFQAGYHAAKIFGAEQIVFHTGYVPDTYPDKYWLQNIKEFWQAFLKDKDKSFNFYIENVLDRDYGLIRELIDEMNEPNLKICLDVGHVNAYSKKPVEEWIMALKDRIGYVHLHNNDGTRDAHNGLCHGTIQMKEVLKLLKKEAPGAQWSLEIADEKMLRESLMWLKQEGML